MFLHYIHINKKWYYFFNETNDNKTFRPYETAGTIRNDLFYFAGEDVKRAKAKRILKEMFPDYPKPILNYPYHEGPRGPKRIKF